MRLPNGYGSVYRLSGNRRRPWIARKTIGWTEDGKQQYYTVGYFRTRAEAMAALAQYNKNPIGPTRDITLQELYDNWSKGKYEKLPSYKSVQTYQTAWNHLSALADMKMRDLKTSHIQMVIDDMHINKQLGQSSCQKVKVLAGMLCKAAMADDIISVNYAEMVELYPGEDKEQDFFVETEIKQIETLAETDMWAASILIMLYTGWRIGELLALTKFSVDLDNLVFVGGGKTSAGKDRPIPIHPKIAKHVRSWYAEPGSYLITRNGKNISVNYYRTRFYYPTLEKAGVRRLTPHATRHTFATMLNRAKVDPKAAQILMGHADISTTHNIYTHVELQDLRTAINSI